MHSGELSQESLEELNLNRVTHNSDIGQHLVDPRSVPTERTSARTQSAPPLPTCFKTTAIIRGLAIFKEYFRQQLISDLHPHVFYFTSFKEHEPAPLNSQCSNQINSCDSYIRKRKDA